MPYFAIAFLLVIAAQTLGFAIYNWQKRQYLQFAGVVLLILVMLGLPIYVLFTR
ncbi:MAG TPA: hypothetical protein PLZ84_00570 [Clostridia bacterium]|nr:hypothetical protein [Clostridia bacterium]